MKMRNPYQLETVYKERNYSEEKIKENIGSEILGVLKLKNANREPYYKIYDSDLSNYIYVTGKHKIRYNDKYIYVKEYPYAEKTDIVDDELACLITNDHIINIGCHVFADWEIE